jgi:hypothetical protein
MKIKIHKNDRPNGHRVFVEIAHNGRTGSNVSFVKYEPEPKLSELPAYLESHYINRFK